MGFAQHENIKLDKACQPESNWRYYLPEQWSIFGGVNRKIDRKRAREIQTIESDLDRVSETILFILESVGKVPSVGEIDDIVAILSQCRDQSNYYGLLDRFNSKAELRLAAKERVEAFASIALSMKPQDLFSLRAATTPSEQDIQRGLFKPTPTAINITKTLSGEKGEIIVGRGTSTHVETCIRLMMLCEENLQRPDLRVVE